MAAISMSYTKEKAATHISNTLAGRVVPVTGAFNFQTTLLGVLHTGTPIFGTIPCPRASGLLRTIRGWGPRSQGLQVAQTSPEVDLHRPEVCVWVPSLPDPLLERFCVLFGVELEEAASYSAPRAICVALLDSLASPTGPYGRFDRSPMGRKVVEPSLGAAQELFQAALHTSSLLLDEQDPARGSSIPPTAWTLSGKTRNQLAHVYNGNSAREGGESELDEVKRKIRQVEAALDPTSDVAARGMYATDWTRPELQRELGQLRKKKNQLREEKILLRYQQLQPDIVETLQELMRRLEVVEKQNEESQEELRALAVLTTTAVDRHALSPVESLNQGGSQDSEGRRQALEAVLRTAQRLREAAVTRPPSPYQGKDATRRLPVDSAV
uniref:Uncharacterized protein n=1 Tax=Chromera velia CCMP2878 TaxID=1169474 RepID=A0A0G4GU74_9ALVE|eukprot:Cvel_5202.t1-p1 / transcript=Cvel_5202.t1 / gene=Cvel_5202 / organism=Chromera_velia_CCMP2878 / gene_product=hypothetical protein / transcript_product=hypothetical protein / location=Cvel_scaffold239:50548-60890(-) / protein_length=382 / sequence_SO=supercontig / SO=protein_coding / is_pseudo=false